MKYTDLLVFIFLLFIFSVGSSSWYKAYSNLKLANEEYIEKINSNVFISKSFRNTCQGKGFSTLYQWQKCCKAMWNLKYIGWSDTNDIMIRGDHFKGLALYGTWKGQNYQGEVYWKEDE